MIRFTNKQIEILRVINEGNDDGTLCSVYDILEKLTYECRRDNLLHSIRRLVEDGYVERKDRVMRGKRTHRTFVCTPKASEIL